MKRPIPLLPMALAASLVVALAGCGPSSGGLPRGSAAPSAEPSVVPGSPDVPPNPSPSTPGSTATPTEPASSSGGGGEPTPAPSGSTVIRSYFYLAARDETAGLVAVLRVLPKTQAVATAAAEALLAGPLASERGASPAISTAVPDGTRLLGLSILDGVATVDLSREFATGGGSLSIRLRVAQVVYTLTQFPSVKSVVFEMDGRPVTVFGGEGLLLDEPVGRAAFEDLLPPIWVDRPAWGASIGNPARVTGSANVFEAQFLISLFDESGRTLFEGPVMATCGTGCHGTFDVTFDYDVDHAQWGTLRAWNRSAADGSPEDIRDYPVWLTPAR